MAAMYSIYHGPKGLKEIATRVNGLAQVLTQVAKNYNLETKGNTDKVTYFDTVVIKNIKYTSINLDQNNFGNSSRNTTSMFEFAATPLSLFL